MTTKMYNKISKLSAIRKYGKTFEVLLDKLQKEVETKGITANQIVQILDMMYSQKEYGYNQAINENK